jgi:hypothetical protein
MNRQGDKPHIQLDWYNVRYRTLLLWVLLLGGAAAGGGGYFYHFRYVLNSPQGQARAAIQQAEATFEEASGQVKGERLEALREDASGHLDTARSHYDQRRFNDARAAAMTSQNYSKRLLDIVRGGEAASKEVRFYKIEGDAKVKRAGQFIWEAADSDLPLSVGDQIKTSSSSTVQIIYFDGTITTVKPGSLLEIKELYEHPTTKVRKVREKLNFGGVTSTVAGSNVAGSYHEVATATTSTRSHERSEIEVGFDDKTQKTEVRLLSGKAEVEAGRRAIQLAPSEMVAVAQDQSLLSKGNMPPAPDLQQPIDQKVLVYQNAERAVTELSWKSMPQAAQYHLQISRRSLLGELLLDKKDVKSSSVKLPRLKVGSYYWRVAAVNAEGVEGPFSETRKFKIITTDLSDQADKSPPAVEIRDFLVFAYQVIINGRTEPGAVVSIDGQKVDVYDDGTFTAVVKLRREGKNTLTIMAQDLSGNETQIKRTAYVEAF